MRDALWSEMYGQTDIREFESIQAEDLPVYQKSSVYKKGLYLTRAYFPGFRLVQLPLKLVTKYNCTTEAFQLRQQLKNFFEGG
jgi:hypothetical protein